MPENSRIVHVLRLEPIFYTDVFFIFLSGRTIWSRSTVMPVLSKLDLELNEICNKLETAQKKHYSILLTFQ